MIAALIALTRVVEQRVRASRRLRRYGRRALFILARTSRDARALVRLRVMPIV